MKLHTLPSVREKVGLSTSVIYARVAEGSFPQPIRIGERQVAWLESELDEWIEKRVVERHKHKPITGPTPRGTRRVAP